MIIRGTSYTVRQPIPTFPDRYTVRAFLPGERNPKSWLCVVIGGPCDLQFIEAHELELAPLALPAPAA